MQGVAGFDWRTLGKADYSQAAALVASLPEEQRRCLDGVDRELTVRILHLSWSFAARSGKGVAYCWPNLTTLSGWVNRSVRTVERHLKKLAGMGLISWKRRTADTGKQTSNLYQMGKSFLASLFARQNKKVQRIQTPTKMSHNDLKREYKASAPMQRGERLTDLLLKRRAEQKQPLGAATFDSAVDHWGTEEAVVDRKAFIKAQYASMQKEESW